MTAQILVVEDEGIVAKDLENRLIALGYAVPAVVSGGEQAIEKARETRPDLALMDILIEGKMDGIEAAAAIRAKEMATGGHIPIIAMTAHAVKGFRERCLAAGMDDYITKPINPEELFRAVEAAAATSVRRPVECSSS